MCPPPADKSEALGLCSGPSAGCRGIAADIRRRRPWYKSDWLDGWNAKTTASIFYMFFTSIAPAITFAELLDSATHGKIGVVEVCLSSCVSGLIFSVFAGQPLVIVGVTGPVTILTITIYQMADALNIKFLYFYSWAQIFAGLMHMAVAALGWCDYIKYITNFSCHTFGLLIATIYAVVGWTSVVKYYTRSMPFAAALLQTIIAMGVVLVATFLSDARRWTLGTEKLRVFVSDYAPTMAIILWTGISKIGRAGHLGGDLPRVNVPRNFGTTDGRSWVLDFFSLEGWAIVLALVPALIILVLFIFDHNVSSIMAQGAEFKLKKGSAYHLDFFVLGVCIVVTGILGIPPCNGLIPQAPLHTKSLGVLRTEERNGVRVDVVEKTWEQRYTNFGQALLTGVVLFRPLIGILGLVPNAALHGLFIFMALASLPGNELWERVCLVASEPRLRKSTRAWYEAVDFSTISRFTKLQFALAFVIFFVTITPIAMSFPLFIAALVFVRTKFLPRHFSAADLEALDPLIDLAPADPPAKKTQSREDLMGGEDGERGASG
mmetsp:Transcript_1537/g.4505  ORF Transcript_1537/g.4505 Transcript_1537/m.4505 type:complete len:548 (-) Transcript_1537:34-1677(-)